MVEGARLTVLQQTAVEQTKAVFAPLKQKIAEATAKLQDQIATGEEEGAPEAELYVLT